jgi:nucleotide-binding universal stress UspA family protein
VSVFPTKILLATDNSKEAQLAANAAVELSTKLQSELHVAYVAPEHNYVHAFYDLRHREEEERFRREDRRALEEYVDHVREAGGTIAESHLMVGDAAKEIVELAERLGVGLVVVGSRGHGRIRRALIGSVSTSVLRHAHCSVLVVRGYGDEQETLGLSDKKIFVATDGSEEASGAALAAIELARASDSELHVVYALQEERYRPHLGPEMWEGWQAGFERAKRGARAWVEEQQSSCGVRGQRQWRHTSC